jgi:transcriptional regulator with XRE-family HTH domain
MNTEVPTKVKISRVKDYDKVIGKKLRRLRLVHNLSQKDIAKLLNISLQQIDKYEKGINRISLSSFILLSQHFKIDVATFFDLTYEKANTETSELQLKAINLFTSLVANLKDETIKVLLALIKSMLNDNA